MILLSEANKMAVYEIYRKNAKMNGISLSLMMEMLALVNTTELDTETVGNTPGYWDFLMAVLDNIETGKWNTYPNLWYDYYMASKSTDLILAQINKRKQLYLTKRKKLCDKLGIADGWLQDKYLVMYWVRNPNGERDILETLYTIIRMFLDFTNSTITGKTKEVGTVLVSFNRANQAKKPVIGTNKQQVVANTFNPITGEY